MYYILKNLYYKRTQDNSSDLMKILKIKKCITLIQEVYYILYYFSFP